MDNKRTLFLILLLLPAFLYGCYHRNAEDLYPATGSSTCDTSNITYASVIKPIIEANCAKSGCHLGATYTGYDLSSYTGLAAVAHSGKLVAAIEHTGPNPMPQDAAKLDNCTISKIKKWVSEGAPDN